MAAKERPLRKDAERNRQRILDAARELFAQRGLGATLNDIAHHAGVGVGTVYRHFPDRSELIERLFEQRLEEIVGLVEEARTDPDAWRGITSFLERALELQAEDRGLKELMLGSPDAPKRLARTGAKLRPVFAELVERARTAGQLRTDCIPEDLAVVQLMLSAVIDAEQGVAPELWRRYYAILLQGLKADPGPPDPLPSPAVSSREWNRVLLGTRKHRRT